MLVVYYNISMVFGGFLCVAGGLGWTQTVTLQLQLQKHSNSAKPNKIYIVRLISIQLLLYYHRVIIFYCVEIAHDLVLVVLDIAVACMVQLHP